MGNDDYIEYGGYLGFIKTNGRCAITGQPFTEEEGIATVPLPNNADWPFPVWGDYPLGANAKALAFIRQSQMNETGIPLGSIQEATECNGTTLIYHPVEYKIAEANEIAPTKEV